MANQGRENTEVLDHTMNERARAIAAREQRQARNAITVTQVAPWSLKPKPPDYQPPRPRRRRTPPSSPS